MPVTGDRAVVVLELGVRRGRSTRSTIYDRIVRMTVVVVFVLMLVVMIMAILGEQLGEAALLVGVHMGVLAARVRMVVHACGGHAEGDEKQRGGRRGDAGDLLAHAHQPLIDAAAG